MILIFTVDDQLLGMIVQQLIFDLNDDKTWSDSYCDWCELENQVLQRSTSLKGYAYLIDQIRLHLGKGLTRDQAISFAIDHCINLNVLSEFLQKNYTEVAKMLSWEYDQEAEYRIIRQEAKEEGIHEVAKNALQNGLSMEFTAQITGLSLNTIKSVRQKIAS